MISDLPTYANVPVWRIDPRLRIIAAVVTSVLLVFVTSFPLLRFWVLFPIVFLLVHFGPGFLKRFLLLNLFCLTLLALMPWNVPGQALWSLGAFTYSREGLEMAMILAVRANAILVTITAFVGTLDPVTFAHALQHMRVPQKLVQLFLFTVRYISVFEREYYQLRRAMTIRAFEPRLNLHTLHSYGNLVGMLLVGALDRSERVNQAMKCRGFSGRFPHFFEYRFTLLDFAYFTAVVLPLNILLVVLIVVR